MGSSKRQGTLFAAEQLSGLAEGVVAINSRCRIETKGGYRVVSVSGLTLAHYAAGDRMAEAHAMVSLVEQSWAKQIEVESAFGSTSEPCDATCGVLRPAGCLRWVGG